MSELKNDESVESAEATDPGGDDRDARIARLEKAIQAQLRHTQRAEQHIKHLDDCLSLVQRHGSDILARMAKDGKIRYCTPSVATVLGIQPEQWIGRHLSDLVPKDERGRLRGFLQETGRSTQVETCTLHFWNKEQKLVELTCLFQTIPHIQNLTPEIVLLARRAGAAAASPAPVAGEFGARLAHELSQPLTAIGTTSRVCSRHLRELLGADHEMTQALEQIAAESERAAEMIVRLRQLSHGGAPHRSSVDVNQLLRESVGASEKDLAEAGVQLAWELARDLPQLQLDRIQLGEVIHNLLRNALEALAGVKSGPRQILVGSRLSERVIEISIADTGPGIAKDMKEKLFSPYQTTKSKGLGMGLALSRSIIEAHKGNLLAQDNTPRGARFVITLPV